MEKQLKQAIKITAAVFLLALSINMFLGPHHIAAGGVSGIGILLEFAFGINRAWIVLFLNLIMLILAAIFLGKKVFLNTLLGSLLFPIFLRIIPEIMLTQDRLLSVVFGSVVFAVGVAILYKIQASSGGTTIPPLILEKYFNISTSLGLFLTDVIIVCMNLYFFGFEEFLFAILSIVITSVVMNYIETGLKRKKAIMIISQNHSEILKKELFENINRGMTLFNVRGGNLEENKEMILMVISGREYPAVKEVIDKIDPSSFVIIYNVAEVHGLGFSYHPIQ
ncbi:MULTISPECIES: YitT family protein [unclassified Enterococcus]|uniref:YitT family protein n=1 Tax=unclassified Enterococcus TaxID=2608891 RepID=UPI001554F26B|nr:MULTISPECIES: YitT family protein [unclassified Enterococcus]MBS7575925.1 YitT family protein [Enterococcus sp. MMGLQ5-2]MBS7583158.1 YitT family protein [Enterococcus sp. MMGLQ5-1]NPD11018.1 YitT family protein [Enterococcus sp. MMGLQ5-1]NPD35761.1 YitT family protein [Enterococcus sp. MMGLQ5-2]